MPEVFLRKKRKLKHVGGRVPEELVKRFKNVVDKHFDGNNSAALRKALLDLVAKYEE